MTIMEVIENTTIFNNDFQNLYTKVTKFLEVTKISVSSELNSTLSE